MKKKIQKPFDAEAAKKGAKVETRDGDSVRILCYDRKSNNLNINFPIIALTNHNGIESCFSYTSEGRLLGNDFDIGEDAHDLVIIEEVEETKFNVGDWVIAMNRTSYPLLITAITPHCYELQYNGCKTKMHQTTVDTFYHLWTLDDARPGDVLVCKNDDHPFIFKGCIDEAHPGYPIAYCGINCNNEFASDTGQNWWTDSSVRPATYEERQLLFNKLEEEGYKWNTDTLTLSKIQKRWRDDENAIVAGYFIDCDSRIEQYSGYNISYDNNVFATKKQAKSALAMARISQIMANDERFGGVVTDEEWGNNVPCYYVILKVRNILVITTSYRYEYLGFHTMEQANLFLEENEDLVKDYYMMN